MGGMVMISSLGVLGASAVRSSRRVGLAVGVAMAGLGCSGQAVDDVVDDAGARDAEAGTDGTVDLDVGVGSVEAGRETASDAEAAVAVVGDGSCGGFSAAAATDGGGCPAGSVTFELDPGAGQWWAGSSQDTPSSNYNWLTLECASQAPLYLAPSQMMTMVDCRTCAPGWAVPIGFAWEQLGGDGGARSVVKSWDGTVYVPGTCGASANVCLNPQCAAPGQYTAHLCACSDANFNQGNCTTPTCMTMPFGYPAAGMVTGTLPGGDM